MVAVGDLHMRTGLKQIPEYMLQISVRYCFICSRLSASSACAVTDSKSRGVVVMYQTNSVPYRRKYVCICLLLDFRVRVSVSITVRIRC